MSLPSDLLQDGVTRLRTLEPSDIDAVMSWENDPGHWMVTGTVAPFSRAAMEAHCMGHQDIYTSGQLRWVIEENGRAVGAVDLYSFSAKDQRAGIGILVAPDSRGQGTAQRALNIGLRHAEQALMLRSVHAEVHAHHDKSLHLFGSQGFDPVGRYRDWTRSPEGWSDVVLFQKLLNATEA